ncbi:MAG: hypothetical protein AB1489_31445 [Acidobacteriota bacterium]
MRGLIPSFAGTTGKNASSKIAGQVLSHTWKLARLEPWDGSSGMADIHIDASPSPT